MVPDAADPDREVQNQPGINSDNANGTMVMQHAQYDPSGIIGRYYRCLVWGRYDQNDQIFLIFIIIHFYHLSYLFM